MDANTPNDKPAGLINIDAISQEMHVRPEILKRIITSFAQTLTEKNTGLEDALLKDDALRARAILHEVRGTSGNLRLHEVYDSARILHEAVKAGEPKENLLKYFEVLKAHSKELTEFVKQ